MDLWEFEREYAEKGYKMICGVDEAGRGPLAGPVCAAAVILPFGADIPGLNDSKKVSAVKREKLYELITDSAISYGVAMVSQEVIDHINILNATYLAMNEAIAKLDVSPDISFIDGNRSAGIKYNNICIVGGDGKSASVAAASILAKVTRDRFMLEAAKEYPQYLFEKHKGYGTKLHFEKIREFGPCPLHRKTFLKKLH